MKLYKKVIPYILMGSAAMVNTDSADAQTRTPDTQSPKFEIKLDTKDMATNAPNVVQQYYFQNTAARLIQRAKNTRDKYISNMLGAQKRLAPHISKNSYRAAVRKELPGAPVGMHCMYGQYTQLMRALNEQGDTVTVIPQGAKSACAQFKTIMQKKYSGPEYAGVIHTGHAYESQAEYNAALEKFLATRGITKRTEQTKRAAAEAEFAHKNFVLSDINPGAIMIVPRFRGAKNAFHAIMFLGRGQLKAGEFVQNADGKYMFTAHNREQIGNLVDRWDMSNVFVADIEQILQIEYTKELKRLESMTTDNMVKYISGDVQLSREQLLKMDRSDLVRLVQAKYFGDDIRQILSNMATTPRTTMEQQSRLDRG